MNEISIEGVSKTFGSTTALRQVSLEVQPGEFLTVLGPSGSGKSTLLRVIAGLELPDAGRVVINGQVVCDRQVWLPPQERGIGMVFQNYALWPHMTAFQNVAFPLEMTGLRPAEITARVREMLALVELSDLAQKRPGEMSGGEQQRVALARALVGRPALLLMDECLSNLDARLREKMSVELRCIQETVGVTTLYVTHDQHEALALSDRIAVLHQGVLQQVGAPAELYHHPRNPLVAASLGPINLLPPAEAYRLGLIDRLSESGNGHIILGVRPEAVKVAPAVNGSTRHVGRVTRITYLGSDYHCWLEAGTFTLRARLPVTPTFSPGDEISFWIEPQSWLKLDTTELLPQKI
jgi:ABC-type sugar transport system ATPase subunit